MVQKQLFVTETANYFFKNRQADYVTCAPISAQISSDGDDAKARVVSQEYQQIDQI